MKRKIRLLLAVVLAMAMVMGSSVTALAKVFTGCSSVSPYKISEMETGDNLIIDDPSYHMIYVKNDTGRTVYSYGDSGDSPTQVLFTDTQTPYGDCTVPFLGDSFSLSSNEILSWGLVSNDRATVTIRMSAPVPPDNEPEHVHNFTWQTICEPTLNSAGLEAEVCSCGARRNVQPISAYGYVLNQYAVPMINAAKEGDTVTFEMGEWSSYPLWFMKKIADKPTVTYVFKYFYEDSDYEVTIKAGDKFALDCEWYGPLKMPTLFDTVITKR